MVHLFIDKECYFVQGVLFVPKLTKNLLSVLAMTLMWAEIRFNKEKSLVPKDGKEFVIGSPRHDKLYTVNTTELEIQQPKACHCLQFGTVGWVILNIST